MPTAENNTVIRASDRKNSMIVAKSNSLIQKTRYDLSLVEQKIVLRIISMIDPVKDTELVTYEFSIAEFARLCGHSAQSGKNYATIKARIKSLADKSFFVVRPGTQRETLVRWISDVDIDRGVGTVRIKLDPKLTPYLTQLKELFTQFNITYTMRMRSQYSIRLYELFKSYENLFYPKKPGVAPIDYYDFNVEQLKLQLSEAIDPNDKGRSKKKTLAEKYSNWADFKRFVIDVAMREINELTDIDIEYEAFSTGAHGKKIDTLRIRLTRKNKAMKDALLSASENLKSNQLNEELAKADALIMKEAAEDMGPILPYVSIKTGTIEYAAGADPERMAEELRVRADYDLLAESMNKVELETLDSVIRLLAEMANNTSHGQVSIDGGNKGVIEAINNVIIEYSGMTEWFAAVVKKYEHLLDGKSVKNPSAYLKKCLLQDLQFYRVLIQEQQPKKKGKTMFSYDPSLFED